MPLVDLRSDTVTKPSPAMREAMARAEVGDDVYGEDPTVNRLQERVAELLGKAAALFVPSGVMANQISLAVQTRPGDEVLISRGAHCMWYESGAGPALAGVQFRELGGDDGLFTARDLAAMIHPNHSQYPVSALASVENSHNRGGGRIFPQRSILEIAAVARKHGLKLHLDGARLWNVHVAAATPLAELCAPFDTVSVCLSKGLGAPVGSLVAGDAPTIARALRRRKMMGGGMRQAGILAAAGLYALDHQLARLAEDHANARAFAERIGKMPGITVGPVDTNIVIWDLAPEVPLDAAAFVKRARDRGLLLNAMGDRRVRAVTHLDVSGAEVARGAEIAVEVLNGC